MNKALEDFIKNLLLAASNNLPTSYIDSDSIVIMAIDNVRDSIELPAIWLQVFSENPNRLKNEIDTATHLAKSAVWFYVNNLPESTRYFQDLNNWEYVIKRNPEEIRTAFTQTANDTKWLKLPIRHEK